MRLIIVDGLDGVGKDTHAEFIKKRYEEKGERVVLRSHPNSDNYFGRRSKQALLGTGKSDKILASVFYMFDVLRSIRKFYRRKDVDTLIMVRYLVGTAYLPKKIAKYGYRFFENFVPTSRHMIFLDASPKELLRRIEERDETEMFETIDALVKVRKKALSLVKNWNIIDTSGSIEKTRSNIEDLLDKLD